MSHCQWQSLSVQICVLLHIICQREKLIFSSSLFLVDWARAMGQWGCFDMQPTRRAGRGRHGWIWKGGVPDPRRLAGRTRCRARVGNATYTHQYVPVRPVLLALHTVLYTAYMMMTWGGASLCSNEL